MPRDGKPVQAGHALLLGTLQVGKVVFGALTGHRDSCLPRPPRLDLFLQPFSAKAGFQVLLTLDCCFSRIEFLEVDNTKRLVASRPIRALSFLVFVPTAAEILGLADVIAAIFTFNRVNEKQALSRRFILLPQHNR